MRYVLPALIVCIACAALGRASEVPLVGMLHPACRDWVQRPGEMYGFWLWWGPGAVNDPVARTGANATSMHLMMRLEEAPEGARVVTRTIEDPALDKLAGIGVGLGEHNNPFFVRYPKWLWKLHQEARMKEANGKTIRAGENRVPGMLDPLLTRLAKEQTSQMVRLLGDKSWARYWVIGGEQSWPDYFGLPAGDYSPAMRRHFTAWEAKVDASVAECNAAAEASVGIRRASAAPSARVDSATESSASRRADDWRRFRDSVVVDRYAGYSAWLHTLDPTRPAMMPTHGNPFTLDFRQRLGYPIGDLAGVVDGFEAGPISIDDDAERIIRMTLDQQTSFGIPVVAPRLANKQLDPAARGGGRTFTPSTLRRTVYEALGLGVWHIGLVQWVGDLPDGEWGIANTPAEAEAKRVFEELRKAGPWLDGCSRLQPRVGIFISDAQWRERWQDRWTLLYDEAIKRGWSVMLLTDVQIDARLASQTPVLLTVDGVDVSTETQARLEAYRLAGGRVITVPDAEGPAVKVIHQTQTTKGANTWAFDVRPLDLDAVEAEAGEALRPVTVLENGKRAEGIEPLPLTDGTNVQVVLINRTERRRSARLLPGRSVRDLITGKPVSAEVPIDPLGTALVALEPPITAEDAKSEVERAESTIVRWTKLGVDTKGFEPILDCARRHLKADRPSKAYALARSTTQGLGLRLSSDGSNGLNMEVHAWNANGNPARDAQVRMRLIPGRYEWFTLKEASAGVYKLHMPKSDLPLFYDPSTEKYELADGATSIIVDAVSGERHGGTRATVTLK